jgi:hypothetical protein
LLTFVHRDETSRSAQSGDEYVVLRFDVQVQNVEGQNVERKNVERQNVERKNVERKNVKRQNVERKNVERQNVAKTPENVEFTCFLLTASRRL